MEAKKVNAGREDFDYDLNDDGLKAVMREKFQDMSQAGAAPKAARKSTPAPAKETAKARKDKPLEADWEPVQKLPDNLKADGNLLQDAPDWMDKLKSCAKCTALFGGLCMLFFYWQQAGLMDAAAAMPSMITCGVLAGFGVGKNAGR